MLLLNFPSGFGMLDISIAVSFREYGCFLVDMSRDDSHNNAAFTVGESMDGLKFRFPFFTGVFDAAELHVVLRRDEGFLFLAIFRSL